MNRRGLMVYPRLTQATDTSNIRLVFAAAKETLFQNALRELIGIPGWVILSNSLRGQVDYFEHTVRLYRAAIPSVRTPTPAVHAISSQIPCHSATHVQVLATLGPLATSLDSPKP